MRIVFELANNVVDACGNFLNVLNTAVADAVDDAGLLDGDNIDFAEVADRSNESFDFGASDFECNNMSLVHRF